MRKTIAPAFGRRTMNDNLRPASVVTSATAPIVTPCAATSRDDRREWTGRDESDAFALVSAIRRNLR